MTGLDTNILLRFIAQDDAVQSPIAGRFLSSLNAANPGWISLASVLEIAWVLISRKQSSREQVAEVFDRLLRLDFLVIEQRETVASAVACFRSTRADFADCLIAASARRAGCERLVTFDRVAARDAGMEFLGEAQPAAG